MRTELSRLLLPIWELGGEHAYCPPVLFRQEQYGSYVQGEVSATLVTHRTYLTLNIVAQHLPSADKSSASS